MNDVGASEVHNSTNVSGNFSSMNTTGLPILAVELLYEIVSYFQTIEYPYTSDEVPLPGYLLDGWRALRSLSETCRSLRHKCRPLLWQTVVCAAGYEDQIPDTAGKLRSYASQCVGKRLQRELAALTGLLLGKTGVVGLGQYVQSLTIAVPPETREETIFSLAKCIHSLSNLKTLQIIGPTSPDLGLIFTSPPDTHLGRVLSSAHHHSGLNIYCPSVTHLLLDSTAHAALPCFPNVVKMYCSFHTFHTTIPEPLTWPGDDTYTPDLELPNFDMGTGPDGLVPPFGMSFGVGLGARSRSEEIKLQEVQRSMIRIINENCTLVEEFLVGNPGIEEEASLWAVDFEAGSPAPAGFSSEVSLEGQQPHKGSLVRAIVEAMPNLRVFPRLHVHPDTPVAIVPYLFSSLQDLSSLHLNPSSPLDNRTIEFIGAITGKMGEVSRTMGRKCEFRMQTGPNEMVLPIWPSLEGEGIDIGLETPNFGAILASGY
ncbi:hypothetical protein VKT23_012482 [Stygiomarasmius scandens]|uniref:F-box domain-containing protein n=1 Tax=Marasmiellus scandens TaxID=2682957 RepID=A0ABR1J8V0_9AGAR